MSSIVNTSGKDQFIEEVLKSEIPVLVDFWAPWCPPCRMMAPVLEELSLHFDGKLKIVKVDTMDEENHAIANEYQIQSIPNLKLFKEGTVIEDFVGFRPKEHFEEELNEFIT